MKVDKPQILCVLLGITFYLLGSLVDKYDSALLGGNTLFRNSYGQGDQEQVLLVEGLIDEKAPAVLVLTERRYSEEEAERAFDPAYEALMARVPEENESLGHIRTNLNLPVRIVEHGMLVDWHSDRSEVINAQGEIFNEACPVEGTEVFLTATLRAGEYFRNYVVKTRVFAPDKTKEQRQLDSFGQLLTRLDKAQSNTDRLLLPAQFEGTALRYEMKKDSEYWVFLVLGVIAAALIPLKRRQDAVDQKKKRERQLLLDYSEIVSKLVVLLGAGLPVRGAWERVVVDYEKKAGESGTHRHAYEEMKNVYYLMGRGVAETRAYIEFGNRCRILPYRKLAGILEQNVKNGSAYLRPILEAEMQDAFEQRKSLARRMGEEAGTKLLLPLFLMLGIVMVMVALPAFLAFGV